MRSSDYWTAEVSTFHHTLCKSAGIPQVAYNNYFNRVSLRVMLLLAGYTVGTPAFAHARFLRPLPASFTARAFLPQLLERKAHAHAFVNRSSKAISFGDMMEGIEFTIDSFLSASPWLAQFPGKALMT